jgi:hypothetical protein
MWHNYFGLEIIILLTLLFSLITLIELSFLFQITFLVNIVRMIIQSLLSMKLSLTVNIVTLWNVFHLHINTFVSFATIILTEVNS